MSPPPHEHHAVPVVDEPALIQLVVDIAGHGSLDEVLASISARLRQLVPLDAVGVVLHDPGTNQMRLSALTQQVGAPMQLGATVSVDFGPAGWVWQSQQARVDLLTADDTHPTLRHLYELGYRRVQWLPLTTPRARLGTLVIGRNVIDAFEPEAETLIARASSLLALAIEHAVQIESLQRLQQAVASERDRAHEAMYNLGERVKELTALQQTARLAENDALDTSQLLDGIVALIPPAFQFPQITAAALHLGDLSAATPLFRTTAWMLSAEFATTDGSKGRLDVAYLEERPPAAEGPFLLEERALVDSIVEILASAIERRISDEALRRSEDYLRETVGVAQAERDRAETLLETSQAVSSELNLSLLVRAVATSLSTTLKPYLASIMLWDAQAQGLRVHATFGQQKPTLTEDPVVVLETDSPAMQAFRAERTRTFRRADIEALGARTIERITADGIQSLCVVPLRTARACHGTFSVAKPIDDDFRHDEVALLEQIAKQLAIAIENALTFERADRYRRESDAQRDRAQLLLDITNAVVSELDLKNLLNAISGLLTEKIQHHFASVTLWDEEAKALRRHALAFPSSSGLVREGALVSPGSPATVAYDTGETRVYRWEDIETLGTQPSEVIRAEGLKSICCVPLQTRRGKYGVLSVGKPDDDPFTDDELALLQQVASQLAIALENAVAYLKAERYHQDSLAQRDRLRLLLDVNNVLVSQLESHSLRLSVLGVVRRVIDHDYAALSIFDQEVGELRIVANTYYDERGVLEPRYPLPLGRSPSGIAFQDKATRVFAGSALEQFDDEGMKTLREEGLRSICSVPLITQRGVLGTLSVARRSSDGFSQSEQDLMGEVAGQVAIAVANTLAYQEISSLKDRLTEEKLYLEDEITSQHDFTQIVGSSRALTQVLRQIRTVAPTDATVLLLGETGTGKELLARALHDASKRRTQTFVRVNGAAMPTNLIESELFGYEKGAFTGAVAAKAGRLELAHRGTLFLDEVGDIPIDVQPKLLRALQEQEFERLGSTRTQKVDVRLIAATNRRLEEMIVAGTFRSDLFYRLSVFPIHVPPLRERHEDIPALVHHFVRKFAREMGRTITTIPTATMEALQRWSWPGNIRELENVIERAVILSPASVLQVPSAALQGPSGPASTPTSASRTAQATADSSFQDGEREMILKALREAGGVIGGQDGAAARLGLKRTTLHSKMRKLGIERPGY